MRSRLQAGLFVAAFLGLALGALPAQAGAAVSLSLAVQPGTVRAGDEVVYTITAANAGDQDVLNMAISQVLPAGFNYRAGSTTVSLNGTRLGASEPTVSGRTLTWGGQRLLAARANSVYGMHTFFQDRCDNSYIDFQLDRVLQVGGPGAYVKQLLYWITPETPGPQSCWVHFVNAAYDRGLIPVVRLQGNHGGDAWIKPQPDSPGNYATIAQAYKRVVAGLPRRDNRPLYVEVWNEPNLNEEWSGAANPVEYGQFLVSVAAALRSLGDPRIVILNGALSPGGNYNNLAFIDAMATVPGALQAFDAWAAHPYPGNHPPEYNIHNHTAAHPELTIDSYLLELDRLAARGRSGLRVLLTETGYALGANDYAFEGYAPIDEGNRADYIARALRDYWSHWPEVLGVCPYELVDPYNGWAQWDWLYPDGRRHWQFDTVAGLDKRPVSAPSVLTITFRAQAGPLAGTFTSDVTAAAQGVTLATGRGLAPVTVLPSTPTPTATPRATPGPSPTPPVTPNCPSVLRNGGFEADSDWTPLGGVPGGYSTLQARTGARSLRLGLEGGSPAYCYSSVEQEVALPGGPGSASVGFWYRVASSDPAGDQAYALVRDANQAYHVLGYLNLNAQDWTFATFDTSAYLGQTVALRLTAVNDAGGGATAVYIDDAAWYVCQSSGPTATPLPAPTATGTPRPSPTPTRSPTPTLSPSATPTPLAPGCQDGLRDGGLEAGDGWTILDTACPAAYVSEPVHSGRRSLRLGIAGGDDTRVTYSSAEQAVTIPADATSVRLSFWVYRTSTGGPGDVQYLLLLDEGGGYESLMWELTNAPRWEWREISLDAYRGQRVVLRFGVRNDGDQAPAAMYVDDVALAFCRGTTPTPWPPATPPPAPAWSRRYYLPAAQRTGGTPEALSASIAPVKVLGRPAGSSGRYRALAGDPESGQVYAVGDDGVWALDSTGHSPGRQLLAGHGYRAALTDLENRHLWVSDWDRGALLALDPVTGKRVGQATGLLHPSGIAIYGQRLYVAETSADRVVVLDRRTCGIIGSVLVGSAPYALAVDAQAGRIWVANAGGSTVTVLDARHGIPIGGVRLDGLGHPQGIAVDSRRGRVYVSYLLTPRHHALAIVRADTLQVERVLYGNDRMPLLGTYGLAVEPASGRIFVSDVVGLVALDPDTLAPQVVEPGHGFVPPFGALVDSASGCLFTADSDARMVRALNARMAH